MWMREKWPLDRGCIRQWFLLKIRIYETSSPDVTLKRIFSFNSALWSFFFLTILPFSFFFICDYNIEALHLGMSLHGNFSYFLPQQHRSMLWVCRKRRKLKSFPLSKYYLICCLTSIVDNRWKFLWMKKKLLWLFHRLLCNFN